MLLACSRRHGAIAESTQTNCGQIFKYQGLAGEAVCDYGAWIGTGGQQQSGFRRSYYSEDDGRVISQAHRFWQDYLLKESYLLPSPASCQSDDDCPQDRFAAKPPAPDPKKGGAWGKVTPAHYGEAFLTVDAGVCGSKAIKITVDKLHITDARIADEDRVTVYTVEPYEPEAGEVKAATLCGRGKMVVNGIRGYVGSAEGLEPGRPMTSTSLHTRPRRATLRTLRRQLRWTILARRATWRAWHCSRVGPPSACAAQRDRSRRWRFL